MNGVCLRTCVCVRVTGFSSSRVPTPRAQYFPSSSSLDSAQAHLVHVAAGFQSDPPPLPSPPLLNPPSPTVSVSVSLPRSIN